MSKRFIRRGVSKILFSPTMPASMTAVTRLELTAAEDLTDEIAEVNGFQLENQTIPTPDLGSTFESSIPGTDQAANSSITFYEDEDDDEIETMLPKGQTGVVYILRKGDKPASNSLDVFPVRVASRSPQFSAGNDPARFAVQFTITSKPELDTPVPAAGP
jgi:hypothetical protein